MRRIEFVRRRLLGLTQVDFARLTKVAQATVSRWESGELAPTLSAVTLAKAAVLDRGFSWNDAWLDQISSGDENAAEDCEPEPASAEAAA